MELIKLRSISASSSKKLIKLRSLSASFLSVTCMNLFIQANVIVLEYIVLVVKILIFESIFQTPLNVFNHLNCLLKPHWSLVILSRL